MKILSTFLLIFLTISQLFAQGILDIPKTTIHLKNLQADDQSITQIFKFKNTGDQPILISRVSPMTTTLKADWPKSPVLPKTGGEIKITFNPLQLPENFNYKILVYSNATAPRTELGISGNIVDNPKKPTLLYKYDFDGLKFKSSSVNFNKIYTWQVVSDTIHFFNNRQDEVTVRVQYKPSHLQVNIIPEKVSPGKKGTLIITYDAPRKNDYGYTYESLILSVNNSRDYKNRLSITANLVEDFTKLTKKELSNAPIISLETKEIKFGEIRQGEKANCDFKLTNTGKSPLFIRKVKASCGCTAVTLGEKTIEPGQSTVIRATFDSTGKSGRQIKSITLITNDPKNPETVMTIDGNVKTK